MWECYARSIAYSRKIAGGITIFGSNIIESLNRNSWLFVTSSGVLPHDDSELVQLFLSPHRRGQTRDSRFQRFLRVDRRNYRVGFPAVGVARVTKVPLTEVQERLKPWFTSKTHFEAFKEGNEWKPLLHLVTRSPRRNAHICSSTIIMLDIGRDYFGLVKERKYPNKAPLRTVRKWGEEWTYPSV